MPPVIPIHRRLAHALTCALGACSLAADVARGILAAVIDTFSTPRTLDAIARAYRDDVVGTDPPAWVACIRDDINATDCTERP